MKSIEVQTVIMLRARIEALSREAPRTRAGRESLQATIADLERQILAVRGGAISIATASSAVSLGVV